MSGDLSIKVLRIWGGLDCNGPIIMSQVTLLTSKRKKKKKIIDGSIFFVSIQPKACTITVTSHYCGGIPIQAFS